MYLYLPYNTQKFSIILKKKKINTLLKFTGPYGTLSKIFFSFFIFSIFKKGFLTVKYPKFIFKNFKKIIILKTFITVFNNYINDLSYGFMLQIDSRGVGYRVMKDKCYLFFTLGFSYIWCYKIPYFIYISPIAKMEGCLNFVSGDRTFVTQIVSFLLNIKKLDSYKGKGFFYFQETFILKEKQKKIT